MVVMEHEQDVHGFTIKVNKYYPLDCTNNFRPIGKGYNG